MLSLRTQQKIASRNLLWRQSNQYIIGRQSQVSFVNDRSIAVAVGRAGAKAGGIEHTGSVGAELDSLESTRHIPTDAWVARQHHTAAQTGYI